MIAFAVQQEEPKMVRVYDENKNEIFCQQGKLHQYDSERIAVLRGELYYVYDSSGTLAMTYPSDFGLFDNIAGIVI